MSQKSVLTSEMMALLKKETVIVKKAKDVTNEFKSFSGPPGRYYARLQRISMTANRKSGKVQFNFFNTCLVKCPDAASSDSIPDQQYAGLAMKFTCYTHASDNQTAAEAWERTMQALQSYDVRTDLFGMRVDPQNQATTFHDDLWYKDLGDAIDALNEPRTSPEAKGQPAVVIDVVINDGKGKNIGKQYKNLNVRETVAEDVVVRYVTPKLEISDNDMIPEDDEELDTASIATHSGGQLTWPFTAEFANSVLSSSTSETQLRLDTAEMFKPQAEGGFGLASLEVKLDLLPLSIIKEIAFAGLTNTAMPNVSEFKAPTSTTPTSHGGNTVSTSPYPSTGTIEPLPPSSFSSASPSLNEPITSPPTSHKEPLLSSPTTVPLSTLQQNSSFPPTTSFSSSSSTALLEEEEEDEDVPQRKDPVLEAQLFAGTLDRNGLKQEIVNRGGLGVVPSKDNPVVMVPEQFKKSQTDDFLREWLVGLLTGTTVPKSVVVQSPEVPF